MKTTITTLALMLVTAGATATELVHQFNSPSFSGIGYSSHVLTIEQLEATRRQKLREEEASRIAKAELAAKQTNIAKFLVNVESRIYAQLSKQLADSLFSGGGTTGSMDFQGTNISCFYHCCWLCLGVPVWIKLNLMYSHLNWCHDKICWLCCPS